jgi:NAD(P)-dependent dehydrogenase (short-subunit alcohol dehydrogenase family)
MPDGGTARYGSVISISTAKDICPYPYHWLWILYMFKRLEPMSWFSEQLMENAPAKKMMLKLMAPVSRAGLPEEIAEAAAFLLF